MKKNFWKKVAWLAFPVALQNLLNTILNMCDTLMISSLGEDYVSAIGLANKYFFVFTLIGFGIVSGCSVMSSQFFGKGDEKGLNRVFGLSLVLSIVSGFLFFIPTIFFSNYIMRIFTKSKFIIEVGASYLKIVGISYLFTSISMAITAFSKSINKTKTPMLITFACVLINIFINYTFIFGKFGAPALAADGAAIGTIISRIVEIVALIIFILVSKKGFTLRLKAMFSFEKKFVKKTMILALPVIINESVWGIGTTVYSIIYGHMGDNIVAAMTIAAVLQDLVWVFLIGLSNTTGIIVGNELGAEKFKDAKEHANQLLKANFIFAIVLGLILVSTVHLYVKIYPNISQVVIDYIIAVSIVYACFLPFKAFNVTNVCGVLRSGGDTIFCLFLDGFGVWIIAIPLGLLGAFVFHLPIYFVFLMILCEELIKFIIGLIRYRQGKWIKNVTFAS